MALPIKDGKVTTPFGKKGNMWSTGRHEGIDFAKPVGTPILACAPGQVIGTGVWGGAYGKNSIVIKHVVNKQVLYTMYAHASKLYVKKGDKVTAGQHIADVGAEGNVTGPHLHLECQAKPTWTKGGGIDPKPLLDWQPAAKTPPAKLMDGETLISPESPKKAVAPKNAVLDGEDTPLALSANTTANKLTKLIEVAKAEIGTIEGPKDNETKYGKFTKKNFQPWCGSFVMWCANQAGVKIPDVTYTPAGAESFRKLGTLFDNRKDDPQPGDIVFFDFPDDGIDRISHVGICIKNNGNGTIETIEGNTSGPKGDQRNGGMVLQKTRGYEKGKHKLSIDIVSWGRPDFNAQPKKKV